MYLFFFVVPVTYLHLFLNFRLNPHTLYYFRLKVYNDIGASPESPTSDQTTTEQDSKFNLVISSKIQSNPVLGPVS